MSEIQAYNCTFIFCKWRRITFAKAMKRLFQQSHFTRHSLILHKICFCGQTSSSCRDDIITYERFSCWILEIKTVFWWVVNILNILNSGGKLVRLWRDLIVLCALKDTIHKVIPHWYNTINFCVGSRDNIDVCVLNFYDLCACVGCSFSVFIRRIVYKFLNVGPFDNTAFAVSGKVGIL